MKSSDGIKKDQVHQNALEMQELISEELHEMLSQFLPIFHKCAAMFEGKQLILTGLFQGMEHAFNL